MPTTSANTQAMLDQITGRLREEPAETNGMPLHDAFSASLLAAARDSLLRQPELLGGVQAKELTAPSKSGRPRTDAALPPPAPSAPPRKAMYPTVVDDPTEITKGWFDLVMTTVTTFGPVVMSAMKKDYAPDPQSFDKIMSTVPPERLQDKAWRDTTVNLLTTLVPVALQALRGTKDFTEPGSLPRIDVPAGKDKAWWNDVLGVVVQAAPIALSLL